jgi:hypothetical protein
MISAPKELPMNQLMSRRRWGLERVSIKTSWLLVAARYGRADRREVTTRTFLGEQPHRT